MARDILPRLHPRLGEIRDAHLDHSGFREARLGGVSQISTDRDPRVVYAVAVDLKRTLIRFDALH